MLVTGVRSSWETVLRKSSLRVLSRSSSATWDWAPGRAGLTNGDRALVRHLLHQANLDVVKAVVAPVDQP
jgi:hypothetical protein